MAVLQTTFTEDQAIGYAGMPADSQLKNDTPHQLEGAINLPFGAPAYIGSADNGCDTVVGAGELIGFALEQKGIAVTANRPADVYIPGDMVRIRRKGSLFVACSTAATKRGQVYVTAGKLITNASSGNTAATGWEFDQTIAAAGIVRIIAR